MLDGTIVGMERDGTLIQWDASKQAVYNCGETIEVFGVNNITPSEWDRLKASAKELHGH